MINFDEILREKTTRKDYEASYGGSNGPFDEIEKQMGKMAKAGEDRPKIKSGRGSPKATREYQTHSGNNSPRTIAEGDTYVARYSKTGSLTESKFDEILGLRLNEEDKYQFKGKNGASWEWEDEKNNEAEKEKRAKKDDKKQRSKALFERKLEYPILKEAYDSVNKNRLREQTIGTDGWTEDEDGWDGIDPDDFLEDSDDMAEWDEISGNNDDIDDSYWDDPDVDENGDGIDSDGLNPVTGEFGDMFDLQEDEDEMIADGMIDEEDRWEGALSDDDGYTDDFGDDIDDPEWEGVDRNKKLTEETWEENRKKWSEESGEKDPKPKRKSIADRADEKRKKAEEERKARHMSQMQKEKKENE
jgi:hypothetical protein